MRLIQEWNSPELYTAVNYIHHLRREWKQSQQKDWLILAEEWVQNHVAARMDSENSDERRRAEEWKKRRAVSQFISKMGYMMLNGYITPEDFFGVVPEARRLLLVLEPIERCIVQHFRGLEEPVEEADQPFDKLVFQSITDKYQDWFKLHGDTHLSRLRNS